MKQKTCTVTSYKPWTAFTTELHIFSPKKILQRTLMFTLATLHHSKLQKENTLPKQLFTQKQRIVSLANSKFIIIIVMYM